MWWEVTWDRWAHGGGTIGMGLVSLQDARELAGSHRTSWRSRRLFLQRGVGCLQARKGPSAGPRPLIFWLWISSLQKFKKNKSLLLKFSLPTLVCEQMMQTTASWHFFFFCLQFFSAIMVDSMIRDALSFTVSPISALNTQLFSRELTNLGNHVTWS